jgi:DNA-binding winged helix-turn-helix (wHTH) protein
MGNVRFEFADCVLDTDRRELTRGSQRVAVRPQVFDLLVHLVRNRERVVSKEELLEVVWAGRIVSESTLTSQINAVRKAVGDNGEEQKLIRTIARKGFRFVGQVREQPSRAGLRRNRPCTSTAASRWRRQLCRFPTSRQLPCCHSRI